MPNKVSNYDLKALAAEVRDLKRRVVKLEKKQPTKSSGSFWRSFSVVTFAGLAGAILIVANLTFWTGRTLLDSQRYTEATRAIIQQPAVQDAVALRLSEAIFDRVDVEALLVDALPPRADFVAPTLAANIETSTEKQIKKVVASPEFEKIWVKIQTRSHDRFVRELREYKGDGTINISDIYSRLIERLEGTKLEFIKNVKLPDNIGSIEVVDTPYVENASWVVKNFETIRVMTIALFVLLSILVVYIAKDRHKMTRRLGVFYAVLMLATLVAVRVGRELSVAQIEPRFQEAALQAWQALLSPFVVQTTTLMVLGLVVALIAWVTGSGKRAKRVQQAVNDMFNGKIHKALFKKENTFTKWVGIHRTHLMWFVLVLGILSLLIVSVTISNILWALGFTAVGVAVVYVVAAK